MLNILNVSVCISVLPKSKEDCPLYRLTLDVAHIYLGDGYPEGQGKTAWKFLSIPANIERLEKGLENIHPFTVGESAKIQTEVDRLEKFKQSVIAPLEMGVGEPNEGEYASLTEEEKSEMSQAAIARFEEWKGKILKELPENGARMSCDLRSMNPLNVFWPSLSRDTGAA